MEWCRVDDLIGLKPEPVPAKVTLAAFLISAKELAENSHVQDAFVIAVEQQAKERLERLSALRKIKPVDMTKLSQEVCFPSLFPFKVKCSTTVRRKSSGH